jgi:hypothetical protein
MINRQQAFGDRFSPDPNKVTFFDFGKSAEEIVKNTPYNFNIDPFILIRNSVTTRRAKRCAKRGIDKAPRRQNPWIIYRRDKSAEERFKGQKSSLISKEISFMWSHEPKVVKDLFEVLAKMAEELHERKHKGYKYIPGPVKKLKDKEKKNKQNDIYEGELLTFPPNILTPATDIKPPLLITLPIPGISTPTTMSPPFIKSSLSTPAIDTESFMLPTTVEIPGPPTPATMSPSSFTSSITTGPSTPATDANMSPSSLMTVTSPITTLENQNLFLLSPEVIMTKDFPSLEQSFFSSTADEFFEDDGIAITANTTTTTTTANTTTTTTTTTTFSSSIYFEEKNSDSDWILYPPRFEENEY